MTKIHIVKAVVFSAVFFGCESWTIKKAEHQRINGFELWHWRSLLNVLWIAKRTNQLILQEINHEYLLEVLLLKLKLQYFGQLILRADLLEKTLMLRKIEGQRRRGQKRMMVRWHHLISGHEFEKTQGDSDKQRSLACSSSWSYKGSDMTCN